MTVEQKPVTLYDRASKEWVDVHPNDITEKVASGTHALPSGMDIPVVSPDGELGSIPAENAEEAFRSGFRFQTPADSEADAARKMEQIKQEAYGDRPVTSALMGAAGAMSMGLGPVINNLTGQAENEAETQKRNPISHAVGSVAGALTPGIAGPAKLLRGGAEAIGAGIGEASGLSGLGRNIAGVGEALEPTANIGGLGAAEAVAPSLLSKGVTTAGKIVENLAPNALGSAVEGAFYGLGQGVSEAALGDPNKVTENLIGGLENGFLWGGALGTAGNILSESAPLIKSITRAGTSKINELVQAGAQTASKGLVPVLKAFGKDAESDIVNQLIPRAADRAAVAENAGGLEKVSKLASEAQAEAAARAKELDGSVNQFLRAYPASESADLRRVIQESGNDLSAAAQKFGDEISNLKDTYQAQLSNMTDQPKVIADLVSEAEKSIKQLTALGDSKSKTLANNIRAVLESETSPEILAMKPTERIHFLNGTTQMADEVRMARRLQDAVPSSEGSLGALPGATRELAERFGNKMDSMALKGNPNEFVSSMETQISQKSKMLDDLTAMTGDEGGKLGKILNNPYMSAKLNTVMDNIAQFSPEFEALSGKVKDVQGRQTILDIAAQKANELRGNAPGGKITPSDMETLLDTLMGPKGIRDKATELKALEAELAGAQDLTPVDKYMRIQKALGRDISPQIAELQKLEPTYEALNKLRPDGSANSGGILGTIMSPLRSAASGLKNPYRIMQTLTAIERASNAGAKRINSAIDGAVNVLTTPGARRTAIAAGASVYGSKKALETRQEDFQKQAEFLKQIQSDPNVAVDYLGNRIGTWHGAPAVQAQMGAKMIDIANFLATKIPIDPLQGKSMMGTGTGWSPSDYELSKFNRYVTAAQSPETVIRNVESGIVTPEEIETLKTLYPQTYQSLQSKVLDGITENGAKMSYQQRLAVGTLFGVPSDVTLQPDFIAKMQANHAEKQQDQGGRPEGKSIKIDINPDNSFATETTRITNK